jgi:hypothetical protein
MKTLTVIMKPFAIGMHVCAADFWFCVARLAILVSDIAYSRKRRHWLLAYRLYDGVAVKPTVTTVMMLFLSLYLAASCFAEDKEPPELTQLKLGYETQVNAAMDTINQKYLTQLDVLKKQLDGQGKTEDAMVVQREIYRLTRNKPDTGHTMKDHGLVAYYPFNGNANDESGNGNNGTVNGSTLTADRYGKADSAYSFDGKNDYIDIKDAPVLNFKQALSISFWVNPNVWIPSMGIISKKSSDNDNGFVIYNDGHFSGHPNIRYKGQSGLEGLLPANSVFDIGVWQQWTVTYDGKSVIWYKNGVLDKKYDSVVVSGDMANNVNLHIGHGQTWDAYGHQTYFSGSIDDIRIYKRALSDTEVSQIYSREPANPKPDLETDFRALYLKIKKAPPATNRQQIDAIIKEWQGFIDGHPDAKPDDKCIRDANTQIKNMQDMKALYSK